MLDRTAPARRPPTHRTIVAIVVALSVAIGVTGCGSGSGSPTPPPAATSYEEFHGAFCGAWGSLFTAVGNPDTGELSPLLADLEAAIEAGDGAAVEAAARRIQDELRTGRIRTAFGAGWAPSRRGMAQLDRLLVAMQALIEARRMNWREGLAGASAKGQASFEGAGGLEAWNAMLDRTTWAEVEAARPAGTEARRCANVPVSM